MNAVKGGYVLFSQRQEGREGRGSTIYTRGMRGGEAEAVWEGLPLPGRFPVGGRVLFPKLFLFYFVVFPPSLFFIFRYSARLCWPLDKI